MNLARRMHAKHGGAVPCVQIEYFFDVFGPSKRIIMKLKRKLYYLSLLLNSEFRMLDCHPFAVFTMTFI